MAGCDPRETWESTGWFVGVDGRWRFEIDDSTTVIVSRSSWDRAPCILAHPELYDAYDCARNAVVRILFRPGAQLAGVCRPGMQATALHCARDAEIFLVCETAFDARAAVLHELQHAIQDREGFAPGRSREIAGWESYLASAGEAEARAVERRLELGPAQRRALFPLDSYDMPLALLQTTGATAGYRAAPAPGRAAAHSAPAECNGHGMRGSGGPVR